MKSLCLSTGICMCWQTVDLRVTGVIKGHCICQRVSEGVDDRFTSGSKGYGRLSEDQWLMGWTCQGQKLVLCTFQLNEIIINRLKLSPPRSEVSKSPDVSIYVRHPGVQRSAELEWLIGCTCQMCLDLSSVMFSVLDVWTTWIETRGVYIEGQ